MALCRRCGRVGVQSDRPAAGELHSHSAWSGTFFGVVSDSGLIGRLNVASLAASTGELVDNVAFGTPTVPEPASIILLGISLGAVLAARRRRVSRPDSR